MGGGPYKPANKGVGTLLSVSIFNHERAPMYAYSNSLPANLQNCWTNNNVQLSRWPWNFKHATLRTEKHHSEFGAAIVSVATLAGYDAKSPFRRQFFLYMPQVQNLMGNVLQDQQHGIWQYSMQHRGRSQH